MSINDNWNRDDRYADGQAGQRRTLFVLALAALAVGLLVVSALI